MNTIQCPRCFGRGYLPETRKPSSRNPHGLGFYARTCPRCSGRGEIEPRMVKHRQSGAIVLAFLVLLTMTGAAVAAGHYAELRVRNALALQCARHSDGTDSEIARCYTSRDLPLPEGI